jgi:hypothetical protein
VARLMYRYSVSTIQNTGELNNDNGQHKGSLKMQHGQSAICKHKCFIVVHGVITYTLHDTRGGLRVCTTHFPIRRSRIVPPPTAVIVPTCQGKAAQLSSSITL